MNTTHSQMRGFAIRIVTGLVAVLIVAVLGASPPAYAAPNDTAGADALQTAAKLKKPSGPKVTIAYCGTKKATRNVTIFYKTQEESGDFVRAMIKFTLDDCKVKGAKISILDGAKPSDKPVVKVKGHVKGKVSGLTRFDVTVTYSPEPFRTPSMTNWVSPSLYEKGFDGTYGGDL